MQFNKVNIPKLSRNKYDYVAQGSVGGTTIISGGSGGTDSVSRLIEPIYSDDGEICGIRALYSMSVQGGVNIYTGGEGTNSPSIYDGLPIDNITLYWDNGVLKSKGSDGMDEGKLKTYLDSNAYINNGNKSNYLPAWALAANKPAYTWAEISNKPSWIGADKPGYSWTEIGSKPSWIGVNKPSYVWTEIGGKPSWIGDNKPTYAFSEIGGKPTTLGGYGITDAVTLNTSQAITGAKDFTGGLSVNGCPIAYDTATKVWKITGNLLVTGGLTAYGDMLTGSAILDALPVDATLSKANGVLSVVGGGFLSSITVKLGTVTYNSADGVVSLPAYPTTLPASDVPAWAKAASKPSYSWNEIGSKPTTFAPSAHGHAISEITGLQGVLDGKALASHAHSYLPLGGGTLTGNVTISTDTVIMWSRNSDYAKIHFKNTSDGDTDSYMGFETGDNGNEYFRWAGNAGGTITEWMSLKSDGLRIKGTLVSLGNHTHNYAGSSSVGGAANSANKVNSALSFAAGTFAANTFDGSAAKTINIPTHTSHITNNSGYITASANVASATKLQTARSINGTNFDGTSNITTALWGTARSFSIVSSNGSNASSAVSVNGSGNVSLYLPSTITASLSGNASTATALQTARTLWGQSFRGDGNVSGTLSNVADINMSGNLKFSTSGYHVIQNSSGQQVLCSNNQNTYIGSPAMSTTQLEAGSAWLNVSNGRVNSNGYFQTNSVYAPAYSHDIFLNSANATFGATTNGVVAVDSCRNIISWIDTISGQGYITRYTIGSFRKNSTWGQMILSVGNNDSGTSVGASLVVSGTGVVTIEGNLVVTGGITQYSNGISTTDTFTSNVLRANDCLLVGAGTSKDTPERYICCYGKTGSSYICIGNAPSAGNTGEICYTHVGTGHLDNSISLGFYGGQQFGRLLLRARGNNFLDGSLTASGTITQGSDMRRKNIIKFTGLTVDQVANAPLFDYYWKDLNDGAHTGTSAQYWQNVLPNTVRDNGASGLALDYNGVNIAGLITVSREIVKLKRENEELRQEINQLKERAS